MKVKYVSVYPSDYGKTYYVWQETVDTVKRKFIYEKFLKKFNGAKMANEYAQKRAKQIGAKYFGWSERL